MKMTKSSSKLNSRDVWELVQYPSTGVGVCAIVFVVPYFLILAGESLVSEVSGRKNTGPWLENLLGAIILYFIVSVLPDILGQVSRLCSDLANITDGMSFIKKAFLVIVFVGYEAAWRNLPEVTFFVSVLLLVPAGLTYDKYKAILKEKASSDSGR